MRYVYRAGIKTKLTIRLCLNDLFFTSYSNTILLGLVGISAKWEVNRNMVSVKIKYNAVSIQKATCWLNFIAMEANVE